jgi:hypothetical protein
MNITIDTTLKTITINGQVNGKEFTDEIKKLGIDLKEYSLTTKVESYPYYPFQTIPFQTIPCSTYDTGEPLITFTTSN